MESLTHILLVGIAAAAAWAAAIWINRRGVRRCDNTGDPQRGIVLFVEPVRWLFIIWGFRAVCRALREGGFEGNLRLFRWSRAGGSLFVLPDLMRRRRLDAKAARLARLLDRLAHTHPDSTIHLVGYSTGVYVAFEAVKKASPATRIGQVVALHGTVSPAYDLAGVAKRAAGVLNVYGRTDWLINGLGPLLFGTNDRVHSAACGMIGLRHPAAGVEQRAWRRRDARLGYFGGHFTVMSIAWLRAHITPRLVFR